MFKTRILTPMLVVATFLGISGINTVANASMVSDKQTMVEMGKKSIIYSQNPFWEDFDWADANMVSPAKDNPYRYRGGNVSRFTGAYMTFGTTLGSLIYKVINYDPKDVRRKVFTFKGNRFISYTPKAATVIISYFTNAVDLVDNTVSHFSLHRKIWFIKVNNRWKIKNYYTIMDKLENSTTGHKWVKATPQNYSHFRDCSDKTGTTFPF